MKNQRCKLCLKRFANGRALGNHMRFHMNESSSTSSKQENKDNPKQLKSLLDQDCSFPVETSFDLLQESESETDSSMKSKCKKSKRVIRSRILDTNISKANELSWFEDNESVSSISEINHDEDVAYCLMMLSRDKWIKQEEDAKTEDFDVVNLTKVNTRGGKYRCETCNKVFKSYQALGGHKANHKKIKVKNETEEHETEKAGESRRKEREHECPICSRVFASGQALGGHKRSHLTKSARENHNFVKPFSRKIDLNLPAPLDDDEEINQMELSVVSDAE
ncbi:hypothetical protein LIER_04227 [Lithospermum erythrorhizon]|uniref:C2H2-type domain-containing protein n=1 Tax=Lithospermum erythrorhizon TaxID=34254 RepID=A0AAV3NW05_LITER